MAISISSLAIRLSVDGAGVTSGVNKAGSDLSGLQRQAAMTAPSLEGVRAKILGIVAALGVMGVAMGAVGRMADMEQSAVSFEVMLGSAERAKQVMAEISDFAATTPFELPEVTGAARKLMAFGVEASRLRSTLKAVGDVAAGVGAPISELAELYGKAKVQGRLFAEDVNQLTGRGIPIIQELAHQFGVADSEVRGLVESGQVGFPQLQSAFERMSGSGGKFAGLMEKQSQTLSGRWSTLKDNAWALATAVAEDLMPVMKSALEVLLAIVVQADKWRDWLSVVGRLAISMGVIVGLYRSIAFAAQAWAASQAFVTSLTGVGLIQVAAAAAAAAAVYASLSIAIASSTPSFSAATSEADQLAAAQARAAESAKRLGEARVAATAANNAYIQSLRDLADEGRDVLGDGTVLHDAATRMQVIGESFRAGFIDAGQHQRLKTQAVEALAAAVGLTPEATVAVFARAEKMRSELDRRLVANRIDGTGYEQGLAQIEQMIDRAFRPSEETAAARKAAMEEQQKQIDALRKSADALTESLRTPWQVLGDEVRRYDDLLARGMISAEIHARAVGKSAQAYQDAANAAERVRDAARVAVGAVERGSTGAFSAERSGRDEARRMAAAAVSHLAEVKRTNDLLREIRDTDRPAGPATASTI